MKTEREWRARMMLINRKKEMQRGDEATNHREEMVTKVMLSSEGDDADWEGKCWIAAQLKTEEMKWWCWSWVDGVVGWWSRRTEADVDDRDWKEEVDVGEGGAGDFRDSLKKKRRWWSGDISVKRRRNRDQVTQKEGKKRWTLWPEFGLSYSQNIPIK